MTNDWHRLLIAALCAVGWVVLFFIINFASPRALGFGDVRLAPILGLGLGWLGIRFVILGFFAANLVGAIIGLALIAAKKMSREQPIPYGVFLAIGAGIALYAGPEILAPFRTFG
jgi:leader peptidase (prepilin peptidase)/N-methyltransferase